VIDQQVGAIQLECCIGRRALFCFGMRLLAQGINMQSLLLAVEPFSTWQGLRLERGLPTF
jgi:hypothetical protein